jgi:hypothetical protein
MTMMATQTRTQTRDIIREFLALPGVALPAADWVDGMGDSVSPWTHLRDYLLPEARQCLDHLGETVRLRADRDGWREPVVVTLD